MDTDRITAAVFSSDNKITEKILSDLNKIEFISDIILVSDIGSDYKNIIISDYPFSAETVRKIIDAVSTKYLIAIFGNKRVEINNDSFKKFIDII